MMRKSPVLVQQHTLSVVSPPPPPCLSLSLSVFSTQRVFVLYLCPLSLGWEVGGMGGRGGE